MKTVVCVANVQIYVQIAEKPVHRAVVFALSAVEIVHLVTAKHIALIAVFVANVQKTEDSVKNVDCADTVQLFVRTAERVVKIA